jgi:cytochrome c biogenesis protein CcmG/thiol:disulfide interchange protein DsbE
VYGVPETYVVDGTGHIRYRHVGPLTAADVKEKILPLIGRITSSAESPLGSTGPQ